MSTQVCRVKGYGYKFDYSENIFSFIDDKDIEFDFIDIVGLYGSYYSLRDSNKTDCESNIMIFNDGMCREYKYVIYVTEASYIENSHGDERWVRRFRNDNFIRTYAKSHIETLLQRKDIGYPIEVDFDHW
jgi:hypothetical protein